VDRSKLAKYVEDQDLVVATRACWDLVEGSSKKPEQKAQSFVEHIQKRLDLPVPKEWKEQLLKIFVNRDKVLRGVPIDFASILQDRKSGFNFNSEPPLRPEGVKEGLALVRESNKTEFVIKEFTLADLKLRYPFGPKLTKAVISKNKESSFVFFFADFDELYPLFKVDAGSGKIIWEQKVWGVGRLLAVGGPGVRCAVITCNRDKVAIFGMGYAGDLYVEAFSAENGKPLLRFATNNWYARADD
jgi:hypothetical protein